MQTKEELKQQIRSTFFNEEDKRMRDLLLEFVESVPEVNEALLKAVSRIYELFADILDKTADMLVDEAMIDLKIVEKLERLERLKGIKPDEEAKSFKERLISVANTMLIKSKIKKSSGKPQ